MANVCVKNTASALALSILYEPIIRYRTVATGSTVFATLPGLFVALAQNHVRDFPGLRPHQKHPWYALIVHLAALAMHQGGGAALNSSEAWLEALIALTPNDRDGAAWSLMSPDDRPAFLQPPLVGEESSAWKVIATAADQLDMLVTSRNHDLKAARGVNAEPDEWLFALTSLQLQEGFLGAGNYGISRMNGGFASRPSVGLSSRGALGERWLRDALLLAAEHDFLADKFGLAVQDGLTLLWTVPWDGTTSLAFSSLDPLYIEVCRRIRLSARDGKMLARGVGSKVRRVEADALKGVTGDAWTPIDIVEAKALTITRSGFDYRLLSDLLFSGKYEGGLAQSFKGWKPGQPLKLVARGLVRGQGKTEGFHEREVLISPKTQSLLANKQRDVLAALSSERVHAIASMRNILWASLVLLFDSGEAKRDPPPATKARANNFARPFELAENARFFDDLTEEVETIDPVEIRLKWLLGLTDRAEGQLRRAFDAGPRSGMRRYRAQSASLGKFHGSLRGGHSPLPLLAEHFKSLITAKQAEEPNEHDGNE